MRKPAWNWFIAFVWLAILILLMIVGCSAQPRPIVHRDLERVEVELYVEIDPVLTTPEAVYERERETFGEAWQQAERNTAALKAANAKLAEIAKVQGGKK